MANIQAKKATRRGKMAHVTKIVNNIYKLIENSSAIREVKSAIRSLNEAFNGFVIRHEEYVTVLTDDIDIDLATDKLVEIENKVASCKLKAEDYITVQQKEVSSQSQNSKEQKCLISFSAPSGVSSSSKKSTDRLSKREQGKQARKKLDEVEERHYYEGKLQDLKLETLKREMEIRRELELRQAERYIESGSVARSKANKSLNPKSISSLSKEEKNRLAQVDSELLNNTNTRDQENIAVTTPLYEVPKKSIPLAWGEKIVPLGTFDGKKENWLRFIQTFRAVVDNQPYETIVKLAILEQHLTGPAKDCIRGFPFTKNSYPLVLKTLQDRFGSEDDQASFYLGAMDNLPKIKFSDISGLRKFYDDLNANIQIIENMGPEVATHLNDPRRMKLLSSKLPHNLAVAWATYQDDHNIGADMSALAEWLRKKVHILEKVEIQSSTDSGEKRVLTKPVFKPHVYVTTRDEVTQTENKGKKFPGERGNCWVCQDANHWPSECPVLRKMTVDERKQLVQQKGACFKCLLRGHLVKTCRRKSGCSKENCRGTHHTLLYREENKEIGGSRVENENPETSRGKNEQEERRKNTCTTININLNCQKRKVVALPVKKVDVQNGHGQRVTINCLEDSGSQVTLVMNRLVESLGLMKRRNNQLTLSGIGNQNVKLNSDVSFYIQVKDEEMSFPITAYVIPKISNYSAPLDLEEIKERFSYLKDVDVTLDSESVDLLVGQDYPLFRRQLETRYGRPDEPYAVRTVLGWSICGPVDETDDRNLSTHLISSISQPADSTDNFNFKRFWEVEQIPSTEPSLYTPKEQKILNETERTTCRVNKRYQVKLPWKEDVTHVPDSYDVALRRLESTERRLNKQPSLKERYCKAIADYVTDGYVEKLPKKPSDPGWYLPHHPVISEEKNTKLRIVFDSSAKTDGISLNDMVEKGPCLLNDLTGILLCFQRYEIGIAGDISKMFLRVLLDPDDCKYHRFLWRTNEDEEPDTYQFNCVIFGNPASPFLASYVIKRIIKDYGAQKPEACDALDKDLYMDDLIRSCKATLEAQRTVEDVCEMLDEGELKMRNWISNRPCVLNGIPDRVKDGLLQLDQSKEKVLGMTWDPHADQIRFFPELEDISWTKRGVLRQLARIFDPMGLLAAFLVRGKILMQELWRRGRDWDDPLEPDVKASWSTWFSQFADLPEHSDSTSCLGGSGRRKYGTAPVCGRITTCNGSCCVSEMSAE